MQAPILSSPSELQSWLNHAKQPLVFTNGCFDILHRGHVTYLQQAADLGVALIVALNSDASVKRLNKGTERPINLLEDRMAVISALSAVSAVCWFDEDTPLELIKQCRPEVLVKGGDWPIEQIVGCKEVQAWGGVCHSIAFKFERSTTHLVNKIKAE